MIRAQTFLITLQVGDLSKSWGNGDISSWIAREMEWIFQHKHLYPLQIKRCDLSRKLDVSRFSGITPTLRRLRSRHSFSYWKVGFGPKVRGKSEGGDVCYLSTTDSLMWTTRCLSLTRDSNDVPSSSVVVGLFCVAQAHCGKPSM